MKQTEKVFMISDAAKLIKVEAHVLRYWEEELKISTKRNEMGHRYYTQEDVKMFQRVKELKEQGLQLKAIRNMLKSGSLTTMRMNNNKSYQEVNNKTYQEIQSTYTDDEMTKRHVLMVKKGEILPIGEETREQKSIRLQQLLRDMIADALQNNNQELCQEMKETVLKELDYQFRLQEEREDLRQEERTIRQEEHYRQIDELIRNCNKRPKREILFPRRKHAEKK